MDRPIVSPRFASAGHDVSNLMTLRYTTDQYLLHTEANDVHQKIKLNSNDADDGGILRAGQNNNDEDPSMSSSESHESQQSVSKKGSDTMKIGSQSRVEQVKQFKTAELSPVDGGWTNMVWKRGSLRIMTYVVRFVISVLINSEKSKFSFMNRKQFTAINDVTAVYQYYEENKLIRLRVKKKLKQIIKSIIQNTFFYKIVRQAFEFFVTKLLFVVNPSSTMKILWDFFMLSILSWQMIFVPLKICFFIEIDNSILNYILNFMPVYVYWIEIVLNFLTGYYEHGTLIMDQKSIAQHYFKKQFIYDLLNVFPFLVSSYYYESNWLQFCVLIKIKTLKFLADQLEEVLELRTHYQTLIDVLRLLIQFVFLAHLFGCFWHYIGIIQIDYGIQNTWIAAQQITDDPWYIRYTYSIYWSSITTLTIGYGDITPKTSLERIFTVGVAVFSSVVFAYTISSIGQIYSQLNESKKTQRYKMNLIQQFISTRGVNKSLQNKVKKFFEYFIQIDHSQDSECDQLLNQLEPSLKSELKIDIYRKYILKSKLFKSTFSSQYFVYLIRFIDQVCQLVLERQYTPDEQICAADSEIEEMYFVLKGEISLQIQLNQQSGKTHQVSLVKKNHVFGERFFITGDKMPYTGKAITAVRVAYLERTSFFRLLSKYPEELEKYQEAKNKVLMKERVKVQGCELCYQNHKVLACPFVFYYPNVRVIVKRQDNVTQSRVYKQRSYVKSHKTLLDRGGIQYQLISYALESNLLREESLNESLIKNMDLQFIEPTKKQLKRVHTGDTSVEQQADQSHPMTTPIRPSCEQISDDSDVGTNKTNRTSNYGLQKLVTIRQTSQQSQQQFQQKIGLDKIKQMSFKVRKDFKPPDIIELQKISESFESPDLSAKKEPNQEHFDFIETLQFSQTKESEIKKQLWDEFVATQIVEDKERFDKQQDFSYFYPHFNFEKIIETINNKINLRKKNQQKARLTTLGKNRLGQFQNISVRPRKSMITIDPFPFPIDEDRQKSFKS